MKLYNSLSRSMEDFHSLVPQQIRMYTCGPTVYQSAHIGNFRTYTMADLFHRILKVSGYDVMYIMNLTDVGHLTGDNFGDASTGEDRMELAARKEERSAWDIAQHYTNIFLEDYRALGLLPPDQWVKATKHISEQIALIQILEKKGYTYQTSDGIYFATYKFLEYGKLSTLDQIGIGMRIEANPEKRDPKDFALWKFSTLKEHRQMEWDSPWGIGFPGWHIECSAMSMKYLGSQLDVHFGGEDLRSTHHPNEMAQSEAATGKQFVQYWVHVAFLSVNKQKMSKSLGNVYSLQDLKGKGYDPMALKYFYYTGHYRSPINITWDAVQAGQNAINKLRRVVSGYSGTGTVYQDAYNDVLRALQNDMNTPVALARIWRMIREENISSEDVAATLLACDEMFGFNLCTHIELIIPENIRELFIKRDRAKKDRKWNLADELRTKIESEGFSVQDTPQGQKLSIK